MSSPKANVTVQAFLNGVQMAQGVTDANGVCLFSNLPVGNYTIKVVTADGYAVDEGNVENGIVDANAGNNVIDQVDLGNGVQWARAQGVDVAKGATARVDMVIAQAINLSLVITFHPGHPTQYKLKLVSYSVLTENVSVTLNHSVRRDDGDGNLSLISAGYGSLFTIPIGAFKSNELTFTDIDAGNPIQLNDFLDVSVGTKSPGKVVVSFGDTSFIW